MSLQAKSYENVIARQVQINASSVTGVDPVELLLSYSESVLEAAIETEEKQLSLVIAKPCHSIFQSVRAKPYTNFYLEVYAPQ